MESASQFLKALAEQRLREADRAVALIWWHGTHNHAEIDVPQICSELVAAGYPRPNGTRLRARLKSDNRVVKGRDGGFRVRADKLAELEQALGNLSAPRLPKASDSVLPQDLFSKARDYMRKVVAQVNASYDHALYDCCAVMCRRLLETLIIEGYEHHGHDWSGPLWRGQESRDGSRLTEKG